MTKLTAWMQGWMKKKFTLTVMLFVTGNIHAFKFGWDAGSYIAFATLLLGSFAVADVTDKRLNGGQY